MLVAFSKRQYISVNVPTIHENYVGDVEVDGLIVKLALWDTAGVEDYDRLRPLSYPDSHVVLLSFSVDRQTPLITSWTGLVLAYSLTAGIR